MATTMRRALSFHSALAYTAVADGLHGSGKLPWS